MVKYSLWVPKGVSLRFRRTNGNAFGQGSLQKFFFFYWLCWDFIAAWAFSTCGQWGLLSGCRARASHCGGFLLQSKGSRVCGLGSAPGLWSTGSGVVVHRLSCFAECGILPDQGSHPCLLQWQEGSHLLVFLVFLIFKNIFIFGCAGSSLLCGLFSSSGGYSSCDAWASHCDGFSSCRALGREGFNSCGARA